MTAIAMPMPRNFNRLRILATILAFTFFMALGFAATFLAMRMTAPAEVPLKPCATCPSCVCQPLLGGPRCGCPR